MSFDDTQPGGVRAYVVALARHHGVTYSKSREDALADVVTKLADDEIAPDATEDLIIALRRANVIDGPTMVDLLGRYLAEKNRAGLMPGIRKQEE